ncbi:hypothetical protein FHG87_001890 [Trinorchestia longiramus]|nr:hypothetical protein FHG87_001890 [Trinorchestia longiramus]
MKPSSWSEPSLGNVSQTLPQRDPSRHREIFGVQLEVTSLLLEGQTRKLVALQWELESSAAAPSTQGSLKAKEQLRRQLITSIERVQSQFDQLEREYTHQALGRLRNSGKHPMQVGTASAPSNLYLRYEFILCWSSGRNHCVLAVSADEIAAFHQALHHCISSRLTSLHFFTLNIAAFLSITVFLYTQHHYLP